MNAEEGGKRGKGTNEMKENAAEKWNMKELFSSRLNLSIRYKVMTPDDRIFSDP
jgi:hypothetical protein